MKTICKWSCLCVVAVLVSLAMNPGTAEAGRWRRAYIAQVVNPPVYVVPAYDPVIRPRVNVVAPGVRVHVGPGVRVLAPGVRVQVGRGVRVNIGGWYHGWWGGW